MTSISQRKELILRDQWSLSLTHLLLFTNIYDFKQIHNVKNSQISNTASLGGFGTLFSASWAYNAYFWRHFCHISSTVAKERNSGHIRLEDNCYKETCSDKRYWYLKHINFSIYAPNIKWKSWKIKKHGKSCNLRKYTIRTT